MHRHRQAFLVESYRRAVQNPEKSGPAVPRLQEQPQPQEQDQQELTPRHPDQLQESEVVLVHPRLPDQPQEQEVVLVHPRHPDQPQGQEVELRHPRHPDRPQEQGLNPRHPGQLQEQELPWQAVLPERQETGEPLRHQRRCLRGRPDLC